MRWLTALIVIAGCSDPKQPVPDRPMRPRIVAHRGASADAPENTLAAFRRAWHLGVEAIELDVHVTKDGEVVVIHDASTKRTAGVDRPIADQSLAELKMLDVGAWKGPAFAGERIPTLGEVLATIPPGRAMFVEIKSGAVTVPAVAEAVRTGRPSSASILLQGYDPDVLGALAAALPEAPAYWTVDPPLDAAKQPLPYPASLVTEAQRRGFAGVALSYGSVDDALLAAARDAGILVDVWTLNEAPLLTSWAGRDVRWIETDRPDLAPARR
jgi:glycerophosphoryl diester phosphodiesterase